LIHVLQHYTPNFKPLIDITKPIHEAYCNKHGYQLHLKEVPEYGVYNGLEKLNQILEVCKEGDVALVMDADAMLTNMDITIESFLEDDKDLYLSDGLNMGIFIIRKTDWSNTFIYMLLKSINSGQSNCEQDAVELFMKFHKDPKIKVCLHPCFNSYPSIYYPEVPQPVSKEQGNWETGCYVIHTPALTISKRIEILTNIKEQIVYE